MKCWKTKASELIVVMWIWPRSYQASMISPLDGDNLSENQLSRGLPSPHGLVHVSTQDRGTILRRSKPTSSSRSSTFIPWFTPLGERSGIERFASPLLRNPDEHKADLLS